MKKQKRKIELGPHLNDCEIFAERYQMGSTPKTIDNIILSQSYDHPGAIQSGTTKKIKYQTLRSLKNSNYSWLGDSIREGQSDSEPPSSITSQTQSLKETKIDDETLRYLTKQAKQRSTLSKGHTRKKSELKLKEIISKQKVTNLRNKFISKIKRNNSCTSPIEYSGFHLKDDESILRWNGFQTKCFLDNTIGLLSITQILCLFVMFTLALVFPELEGNAFLNFFQIFSIVFYFVEIIYNMVTVRSKAGRKLITLEDIWDHYLKTNLVIDVLNLLILLIDSNTNLSVMHYARLFIITKLPQCLEKMEKLEVTFIKNYHNEQYWSLIKVVLFNFCFAHILAIFLTAMANINQEHNWYELKNINHATWVQKYIWGYYWGVNIMLTVGFGDFYATNYQEAMCLIFIQIISVMCLAYNINWIGTLISNIRAQDIEKGKNFKTFKQLSQKYSLPNQLQWKISNYIQESVNIRKKFNIEEEHSLIGSLPTTMKKEYLKECNKSIFHSLPFFSSLVDKTLYHFAEKIEMTISHPEQLLRRIDDEYNLLILREGEIGYTVKARNCAFNEMVIDKVKVRPNQRPFIMGLQFLTRTRPTYETKSLEYSVIYSLSYEDMINILKESQMDYLHFCFLRDKNKSTLDQFEVLPCQICKNNQKHTKFTCPKLHFMPLYQIAIYRQQDREKKLKNQRSMNEQRIMTHKCNAMTYNRKMRKILSEIPGLVNDKTSHSNRKRANRIGNSFLDRLSMMKQMRDSQREDETERVEQIFFKNTTQMIKQELDRFFRNETFEDEVWTINCDKAKSYKEYFPDCNPCHLEYNFPQEERLEALEKAQDEEQKNIKIGSFSCYLSDNQGHQELKSFAFT